MARVKHSQRLDFNRLAEVLAETAAAVASLPARFRRAMDDDINTAEALGEIFKTARQVSGALSRGEVRTAALLEEFLRSLRETGEVLGLLTSRGGPLTARFACESFPIYRLRRSIGSKSVYQLRRIPMFY